jgi:hypothetical protein
MSVIRPDFLKVLPADIAAVGGDAACVLALVRYATQVPDERNDRLVIEGAVWWRASYAEIGESLGGLGRYTVGRSVSKLVTAGQLLRRDLFGCDGNQTKAYRPEVADKQPKCDSAPVVSSENAESHGTGAKSQQTGAESQQDRCEIAFSIPFRELREEEKGEKAPRPVDDEPVTPEPDQSDNDPPANGKHANGQPPSWVCGPYGPRCHEHRDDPNPPACPGCGDARRADTASKAAERERRDTETAERRRARENCRDCDDEGWAKVYPYDRCTHQHAHGAPMDAPCD